jgi:hypothetical protein
MGVAAMASKANQQTYYSLIGREYEWELMPLAHWAGDDSPERSAAINLCLLSVACTKRPSKGPQLRTNISTA